MTSGQTTVEFIGMIGTRVVSETHPASEPPLDPAVVRRFVDAHEQGGFDRVLVGHSASTPDGLGVAAYGAAHSERLGFLVAHRPGFVAPTLAARSFATLDHFSGGRVAMHVISGGNDADQRRDGDHLDKEARYLRTDEYLEVVTRTWTSTAPFDHHGEHYRVEDVSPDVRPLQQPRIPIYFGGSSPAAHRVGGLRPDRRRDRLRTRPAASGPRRARPPGSRRCAGMTTPPTPAPRTTEEPRA